MKLFGKQPTDSPEKNRRHAVSKVPVFENKDMWSFSATSSQRAGAALIMGVYGEDKACDENLIRKALGNELTHEEIGELELLRPIGEAQRFGPGGRFARRTK